MMTEQADPELQVWMADWRAAPTVPASVEQIRRHVRRRSRLIAAWVAADGAIGTAALVVLLHRFWTEGDALERAAMGLLALVTAGALLFAWWNWHGMLRAPGESTVTYLELAIERARRFTRAARGGWAVLGLQVAVFTPWVAQRLYGGGRVPAPGAQLFAWGLLVGMTAVAAVGLVALGRWSAREARALDDLRAELRDQG